MKKNFLFIIVMFMHTGLVAQNDELMDPRSRETHFDVLSKLTHVGHCINPEVSMNGNLIFQTDERSLDIEANGCPQLYKMRIDDIESSPEILYTGYKANMEGLFMPNGLILHAYIDDEELDCANHKSMENVRKKILPESQEIEILNIEEESYMKITDNNVYDGDMALSSQGQIVYTTMQNGDPDLWIVDAEGQNAMAIVEEIGYEGDATFSPSGEMIVFTANRPKSIAEKRAYKKSLDDGEVQLENMDIYICNSDGSNVHKISDLKSTILSPRFTPDGSKIIFASNHLDTEKDEIQLFMMDINGKNLEQITYLGDFNAYPCFTPTGDFLIFSSNRMAGASGEDRNLIMVNWLD